MENTNLFIDINDISKSGKFYGYASVFNNVDLCKDKMLEGAFSKTIKTFNQDNPIKVLWQHDSLQPIGKITEVLEDHIGLRVEGQLILSVPKAMEARNLIKEKIVKGLSIGYQAKQFAYDKNNVRNISEVELTEISVVTFPANPMATITEVKDVDINGNIQKTNQQPRRDMNNNSINNNVDFETKNIDYSKAKIDEYDNRIKNLELKLNRPNFAGDDRLSLSDNTEHKSAFNEYLRKGIDSNLLQIEKKALSVTSEQDGGYFVTRTIKHGVFEKLSDLVPMRKLASVEKISTDGLEIIEDRDMLDSGWTSETGSIRETGTPRLSKKMIPVHEIYAQPKATQKLIDDAEIDIENWLEDKISKSFAENEDAAFIKGDGLAKPRGILTYPDGKDWGKIEQISSGQVNGVTPASLLKMIYSLESQYLSKACFIMNRQTTFLLRMLKNENNGQYLWNPGFSERGYDTLLGLPVIYSDAMPLPTSGALAIAVADFKSAYQIVDRQNVKVMRDPFTEKPFVKFYATKRIGGDVKNFHAIKLMKIASN